MPTAAELIEAHKSEHKRKSRPRYDPADYPPMAIDSDDDYELARDLLARTDEIETQLSKLNDNARSLLSKIVISDDPSGFEQAMRTLEPLELSEKLDRIRYDQEYALEDLIEAAKRGAAGQKPVPGIFNRGLKAAVQNITIGGKSPENSEDWRFVLATMELEARGPELVKQLELLLTVTNRSPKEPWGWNLSILLRNLQNELSVVLQINSELQSVARQAQKLFPIGLDINAVRACNLVSLSQSLDANLPTLDSIHPAMLNLEKLAAIPNQHELFVRIRNLRRALGEIDTSEEDLVRERSDITRIVQRISSASADLEEVGSSLLGLSLAGAPNWSEALRTSPHEAEQLIPNDWREAWSWGLISGQLDAIIQLGNGDKLRLDKAQTLRHRAKLMEELIRVRTMLGLKSRMKPSIHRAMQAFTQAVSRVGKGTGKTAPRYRAAAQRAAKEVASAAPVWIMPEHRIAEQLPPDIEGFDLVIIDEASQSDITAVAALARGKQALVVGDEEQVSPSNIGIPIQKINALRAEFLSKLPNSDLIDENTSIFEITMRMHPEHHVVLREHFRSVAPIISFSSQFYSNRLVPLRVAKPSERFDPPLVDVFISHSVRKGKTNLGEAEWIVNEIGQMVSDPEHDARDIGVVSLIGSEQSRLIERLLLEDSRIGPEVIRARKIICGDARTMQGQERSVVFLSMVATPSKVIAQTTKEIQQRFNVAMSRARDRVYLVRSVEIEDLKNTDLKRRILEHFEDPLPDGTQVGGSDLLDRCESGFEKEVLERLLDAGYRAIPQVSAGAFRIDIVVEGRDDRRLAIELDGDAYHGPDRWEQDMERQAQLERAGWVFWRVFGSQWQSAKEFWWRDLADTLSKMDIEPIGNAAVADVFVELRTVQNSIELGDNEASSPTSKFSSSIPNEKTPHETGDETPQSDQIGNEETIPKKELSEIELNLFDSLSSDGSEVILDSVVTVEMDDTKLMTLEIVNHSPDPNQGRILDTSPLGAELLGSIVGEEIEFLIGDRLRRATILSVSQSN